MTSIGTSSPSLAAASVSSQQTRRQHHRAEFTKALADQGVSSDKAADIQKQIDAALKSARASGGTRQSAQDTINQILKSNGVDPAKLQASIKAQRQGGNDGDTDDRAGQAAQSTTQGNIDVTA